MIRALPAEDILVARIMSDAILRKVKIKSQHMDMHCLKKKIASARQPLETIRGKTDGHSKTECGDEHECRLCAWSITSRLECQY